MQPRTMYTIAGIFVGIAVDIIANLLAAAIQQRAFSNQFSGQALWILVGLAILGSFAGYWLSASIQVPASALPQSASSTPTVSTSPANKTDKITISRLRAFLSYGKLKGQGIHLSDIVLFGSRIDIET